MRKTVKQSGENREPSNTDFAGAIDDAPESYRLRLNCVNAGMYVADPAR
jgi:hypothetical protein